MRSVLKLRRKGVLILPKAIREAAGLREGSDLLVEVKDGALVLRPLEPAVVDVDPKFVEEVLREERGEWGRKLERTIKESGS
ncbi:MAG: AbrB/MazE/SpoVT family DNA-binding domain-containing protein [Desulfurococcales archaeon]|nr:AbrB/MazE/SpoVT family DNA-binding domain-containing protein [Desulfurococcales archaeon]